MLFGKPCHGGNRKRTLKSNENLTATKTAAIKLAKNVGKLTGIDKFQKSLENHASYRLVVFDNFNSYS